MIALTMLLSALVQAPQTVDRALVVAAVTPVMAEKKIPGAVVAITMGDSIVLLHAFGSRDLASHAPTRIDDIFMVGSITKQFTATLLAMAVDRGQLTLDDIVGKHLDTTKQLPSWTSRVTLRQIATHTAGLPRNPVNRRDIPGGPGVMRPYSRAELYAGLPQTTLASEPPAQWSYSNLGYAILGEVLERVNRRPYEQLLRENILTPLHMSSTGVTFDRAQEAGVPSGYWVTDSVLQAHPRWVIGEVASFAGMHASASDLARFVAAQTANGPGATFSAAVRSTLQTPLVPFPDGQMAAGWFIDELPGGLRVFGGGGEVDSFSAAIAFLAQPRVGFVVLTNRGGESGSAILEAMLKSVLPTVLSPRR